MKKRGFTLIELIIVIIIIGILASIAAPMMSSMKAKGISAEAVMAMGTIRTALRAYYIEYNAYPSMNGWLTGYPAIQSALGLSGNNLTGTYFSADCYGVNTSSAPYYIAAYALTPSTGGGSTPVTRLFDFFTSTAYAGPGGGWSGGQQNNAAKATETYKISDVPGDTNYLKMDLATGRVTQSGISKSGY